MVISEEKLKSLYDKAEEKMPYFKRNSYEQAFRKYYGECLPIYDEINDILKDKEQEDVDKALSEIASDFVHIFKTECDTKIRKGNRKTYVINHNSPLVIFVFTGIQEYKSEWTRPLCEKIVENWNSAFKVTKIGCGTYEEIKGGFKTKLCYITTAVCLSQGLPDDCEELNLLRSYRDNMLVNEPDGKELIDEYYDIAPTIVKRINRSGNSADIYLSIYKNYISKCTAFIKAEKYDMCKNTYISMVRELKSEYAY